ncbi:MAG: lytic transglycosylase domain-containing protein [Thiohalorhabdus sp.]
MRIALPLLALAGLLVAARPAPAEPVDPRLRRDLGAALDRPHSPADRFDQQVWFKDYMRRLQPFVSDPDRRRRLAALVFEEAGRAEIPPGLVFAVIQVESNFQRFALSHAGARGLMQIMPFWREEIGRPGDNLFEPRTNLRYGCTILRHYLEQEGGDILRALAAYNGSTGRTIYPEKIHKAYRGRWAENR